MAGGRRIGPDGRHVAGSSPRGTAATSPRGRCRPRVIGRRPGGRAGAGQRVHAGRRLPSAAPGKPSGDGSKKPGGTAIAPDTRRARLHRQPGHRTYLHVRRVTQAGDCHLSLSTPWRWRERRALTSPVPIRPWLDHRPEIRPVPTSRPFAGNSHPMSSPMSRTWAGHRGFPAFPAAWDSGPGAARRPRRTAPAQSPWRARPSRRGRREHTGAMRAGPPPRGGASRGGSGRSVRDPARACPGAFAAARPVRCEPAPAPHSPTAPPETGIRDQSA